MPGAAPSAANIARCLRTGKQGGHPIAQFDPGNGGLTHRRVGAGNMQDFGPEPLGRINAADVAGVIQELAAPAQRVDGFSFFYCGVVFPQHEHGIGVVGKLGA